MKSDIPRQSLPTLQGTLFTVLLSVVHFQMSGVITQ
jgi:hypothetical protein